MKFLIKVKLGLALLAVTSFGVTAAETILPLTEVSKILAYAKDGDVLLIEDGTYADVNLRWRCPEGRVTVRAKNPGSVRITGKSSLHISGDSLTVSGLWFEGAHPEKGSVMEFRIGKELANYCRLTDCIFTDCNPKQRDIVSSYIVLHGRHNTVDHCTLNGKLNLGVTLLVNLNDARSLENEHIIEYNYFGHRPVYGSNGAETMRIGTSQQAYESSRTRVANNFFEQCNGEVEIISVKSSDNIIENNTFYRCEGVVALRHGLRNTVRDNLFFGDNVKNTGGVRIVDAGHTVTGNIFCDLAGKRFFSALAVMNSVPNSLPNRYVQVSDVAITDNIFVNCTNIEFGTGRDNERTQAPKDVLFADNTIVSDSRNPFTMIDSLSQVTFRNNKIIGKPEKYVAKYRNLIGERRSMTGAMKNLKIDPLESVTDTIVLPGGVVMRSEPIVISRPTVIKGNNTVLRWNGSAGDNFITIANGGSLDVSGVVFDGALQQGHAVVKNGIATSPRMITPYHLTVVNCSFINMPESGCCAIRGTKGTFAEYITVRDCTFSDLSGNGISLADETDDKGRYSADYITVENCRFSHMLGIPVNIYRGGSDESTAGPYVTIKDCNFDDCCNRERGSVLRLIGQQVLAISGCTFNNSGRGGYSVRLDETTWEDINVTDCNFTDAGGILSNRKL